jgi:uncharacterized protein (TIGR03435 family)
MTRRITGSLVVAAVSMVYGQPHATLPAFDVATVKPDTRGTNEGRGRGRESIQTSPVTLSMQNIRLSTALKWAYQVQSYQIVGPSWVDSERYDIFAKAGAPVQERQLRLMLQQLLADRFGLASHHETRNLSAFVLTSKGEPKLKAADGEGESSIEPSAKSALTARRTSISQFVELLSDSLHAPVLDLTGLKGRFDFTVDLAPYMITERPTPDEVPNIWSQVVWDQLGLTLEARKSPIDLIVVDYARKVPIEN